MKRTTIMLDEDLFLDLRQIARREGKSFTQAVRESVAEYVAGHRRPQGLLSIVGIGRGPGPEPGDERSLAERLDEILIAGLDPHEGWSARRPPEAGPVQDRAPNRS